MFSLKNMAVDHVRENQQLKLAGCVVVVRAESIVVSFVMSHWDCYIMLFSGGSNATV